MTSRHPLSARLDALVERLASYSLPTSTTLALEAAAAILAEGSPLQKEYRTFFDAMLKKYGVASPEDLSDEQKSKFFGEVNEGWKEGEGPTEKAKKELSLSARRADIQARLSAKAAERMMVSPMTPPIYDQVFYDGMAALDAALAPSPKRQRSFLVDIFWNPDAGRIAPEALKEPVLSTYQWAKDEGLVIDANAPGYYRLTPKGLKHLSGLDEDVASAVERGMFDKKAVQAATDRDNAVVITIPMPEKYAKRFPDPVTANHGHPPHLTLLFVGNKEYEPGEMSQILSVVRSVARKMPPFRLYVDPNAGLQDFGPNQEKGEKALWLPARSEPRGELERLSRMVRMALEQEGIEVSAHDTFKPHVTWSYVPNDQPEQERNRMNAAVAERFKDGFYFDVRQILLSTPNGSPKVVALNPIPRKK